MKIVKYIEFIKEEFHDTPESYISVKLTQLKKKIDKLFEFGAEPEENVLSPEELQKKNTKDMSLKDLGVQLDSSDISKYSKLYDSLTIKFTDALNSYTLIIMIDIKEAMPEKVEGEEEEKEEKDFDIDDIKKCYIKFKKYDLETFDVVGQITKNVDISGIDENFLIDLKIEIDEKFGDDEEFKIET